MHQMTNLLRLRFYLWGGEKPRIRSRSLLGNRSGRGNEESNAQT